MLPLAVLVFSSTISSITGQSYNDVICRRPWYFNSPRPAPLRCPTPSFFTFYECCGEFLENCCWRFRQEPIIIGVILVVLFLLICCCCCVGWLVFGRRKQKQKTCPAEGSRHKDGQMQTISSVTDSATQADLHDKRRSYAAARDREVDYQYFS